MNSKCKVEVPRFAALTAVIALVFAFVSTAPKAGMQPAPTPKAEFAVSTSKPNAAANSPHTGRAPRLVRDTSCDSPGTNLVSRLLMFSAALDGAPPLFLQWKVNKGNGFVDVDPSQTNQTFWITNAQACDSGWYALFSTNSIGSTNSTPVQILVVEGVD